MDLVVKYFAGLTDEKLDRSIKTYRINLGLDEPERQVTVLSSKTRAKSSCMCDQMPWMRESNERGLQLALEEKQRRTPQPGQQLNLL